MFPYSDLFLPPAPALQITIRNPQTGDMRTVLAKIDTAADGSVISENLVAEMDLLDFDKMVTISFNGREEEQLTYLVDLLVAGREFTDFEVVASPAPYVLLGRDILNQLVITFDGPQLTLEIQS